MIRLEINKNKQSMVSDSKSNDSLNSSVTPKAIKTRQKSDSYTRYTLRQAEELAKTVFELGVRNCDQDKVAQAINYSVKSGGFIRLKSSANQFGLIRLEKGGYLSVSDEWIQVFHSEDLQLFREAQKKAIVQPKLYKKLIEEYSGRQLPSPDKLSRELYLSPKYGILKEAAVTAARIFLESASYTGLLNEKGYLVDIEQIEIREDIKNQEEIVQAPRENQYEFLKDVTQKDELIDKTQELEKYEITLINKKKAYLYVPVPLPPGEKERLKKYIDLILEETPITSIKQDTFYSSKDEQQLSDK